MTAIERVGTVRKLVLVLGALIGLVLGTTASAAAEEQPTQDNIVQAVNTRNNSTLIRTSFRLVFVRGAAVTAQNVAYAYAKCENCTTTAVALEGVVIEGQVPSVKPVNAGLAFNDHCLSCQTLAYAGQVNVQYLSGRVHLTDAGEEQIEAISEGVRALQRPGLSLATIKARAEGLYAQLTYILNHELVAEDGDDSHVDSSRAMARAA